MAADDVQRVWFPEMIERLRAKWRPGMPFEALVELRDDLERMLQRIRKQKKIGLPGPRQREEAPHVTVRSMILGLLRFEIAAAEPTYALEKEWAVYRKQNGLDVQGRKVDTQK